MKTRLVLASCLAFASAACGSDDPLAPGAGDNQGNGTSTLFVSGRASAEPRTPNTQVETDFTTDFSVEVRLNDAPVTTGTVTVSSRFGTTNLTFQADNNRWEGSAPDYDEVYALDVISGADEVRNVIVDGPDIHHITSPTAGASLDSAIANDLKWDRDEPADVITFRTDKIDRITITDTGTYSMGPGTLKAEKDKSVENSLELRRTNHTVPRGAVAGSEFSVTIENSLDVLAQPNPAL